MSGMEDHERRCGRLGDHTSHPWTGLEVVDDPEVRPRRVKFWCTGTVAIEGGYIAVC